jgi:hypothetical protein
MEIVHMLVKSFHACTYLISHGMMLVQYMQVIECLYILMFMDDPFMHVRHNVLCILNKVMEFSYMLSQVIECLYIPSQVMH